MWRTVAAAALGVTLALTLSPVGALAAPARPGNTTRLLDEAADLKQDCEAHPGQAGSRYGWARTRFEQCHHYPLHVVLRRQSGEELGFVDFDLWILAFAYDGSRRVDYVTSVENVHQTSSMRDDLTFLTVMYDGCAGRGDVTCPATLRQERTALGWYQQPAMDVVSITSPDTAGLLPYYTTEFVAQVSYLIEYRDGLTEPALRIVASNAVRFDSAGAALGGGKYKGTVFVDNVPEFVLPMSGVGIDAEAKHVNDALHHPERTFPSFVGKNPPSMLHRLMDASEIEANHRASVGICKDVWGDDYAAGGLDCDEYPFKSTEEGSAYSTAGKPRGAQEWHGSARPINAQQNQLGGSKLNAFYGANRLLDGDGFTVTTAP
ncbi:NucA/NucB deoxyribonuclease domain-containing protein [Dactylosporangium sp. CA-139114]|uniref:NucA/NucB deoxyribonuclease domain-containing protein n=1 Tax=Dactylosporangium sp. CA-139114 TaxID=3239931 RepID=UPI003D97D71B